MKKTILTQLLLTVLTLFQANVLTAQTNSNDNAENHLNNDDKTEINADTKLTKPVVIEGSILDAMEAADGKRLSIYIMEGRNQDRSGAETARLLANAFADRKYTDNPMYITVVYGKSDKFEGTGAQIYMNGAGYVAGGRDTFHAEEIGGAIDGVADAFVERHGNHLVIPADAPVVLIPTND